MICIIIMNMTYMYMYYALWYDMSRYMYMYKHVAQSCSFLLMRLHACSSESLHFFHTSSNCCGSCQNCGHWARTCVLSSYNSFHGKPGSSLVPPGVHFIIPSSPNIASLANFTHRSRILASVDPCPQRCLYFSSTISILASWLVTMAKEDSAFSLAMFVSGRARGWLVGTSTGECAAGDGGSGEVVCVT